MIGSINNETMVNIAAAIRFKNNTSDTYLPSEMPSAILSLCDEDTSFIDAYVSGNLAEFTDETIYDDTAFSCPYILREQTHLVTVNMPNVIRLNNGVFYNCTSLQNVNLPKVAMLSGGNAFYHNTSLSQIELPMCSSIAIRSFEGCTSLRRVDIGKNNTTDGVDIGTNVFLNCSILSAFIIRLTYGVGSLSNTNAFSGTPIESGTGYIYVPSALINTYKTASNWSTFQAQFRAIEDYPDICG